MREKIYWFVALVFALFALVQYNDPDPWGWMLLYGGVSALYALAATGRKYRVVSGLWCLAALVWAALLVPEFVAWLRAGAPSIVGAMKAESPWIEYSREFFGLILTAIASALLLKKTKNP